MEPTAIQPAQAAQITQAIIAAGIFGILLTAWIYSDKIRAALGRLRDRYVQPTDEAQPAPAAAIVEKTPVSRPEINFETAETPQHNAETEREKIVFADQAVAEALARLIAAEKLGLTDAVRIGTGQKSGPAYQAASARIKAAVAKLHAEQRPQFRDLDAERRPALPPREDVKTA